MTDEEIAEEYAKLNARQYKHNDCIGFCTSKEEVKQAFLAGLNEGRPKWHDLRKNPNDLPVGEVNLDMYPDFIGPKPRIKVVAKLFFKGYGHPKPWEEVLSYEDGVWLRTIQGTAGQFLKKIPKSVYVLEWCELPQEEV